MFDTANASEQSQRVVVAIPVKDESENITQSLMALDRQIQRPDSVVLLLNNCTDDSETVAQRLAPDLRFRLDIISRDLPPKQCNAGHARRLVMALAAEQAGANGVLLTTDSDSVVPWDWVARNLYGLRIGADIVCGRAVIDPLDAALIPAHLHADDALECELIALLDDMAWMLDPETHDPPPRHTEASGASLAVTVEAFNRVGGVPAIASGEDRAFVRALWMIDARVRHDSGIKVTVSGRTVGRAQGGMADAIRRRMIQQDEYTDNLVEPAFDAFRRYSLRRRARRAWAGSSDLGLPADLAMSPSEVAAVLKHRFFGSAWADLEAASSILRRRRVRFADLRPQIDAARILLQRLARTETLAAD